MHAAAVGSLPFVHIGQLPGIPIQAFGLVVTVGVLVGASLLRRYAEQHRVEDLHIRGLLTWVIVAGFIGAHELDVIAYQWDKLGDQTVVPPPAWWPGALPVSLYPSNWPLPLRLWETISSFGGFVGGAIGFAVYVRWKRLPVRLMADVTIVGLLPAFTIGRLGCTIVNDHVGAAVDPSAWYAPFAMSYPSGLAWNLGLVELVYLLPINAVVLWLAFRRTQRLNAGLLAALTGILYAPVRFGLDFLRPEDTDPRHLGLTFAQWGALLALTVAAYVALRFRANGTPALQREVASASPA